jgi:hypothetical protein
MAIIYLTRAISEMKVSVGDRLINLFTVSTIQPLCLLVNIFYDNITI